MGDDWDLILQALGYVDPRTTLEQHRMALAHEAVARLREREARLAALERVAEAAREHLSHVSKYTEGGQRLSAREVDLRDALRDLEKLETPDA